MTNGINLAKGHQKSLMTNDTNDIMTTIKNQAHYWHTYVNAKRNLMNAILGIINSGSLVFFTIGVYVVAWCIGWWLHKVVANKNQLTLRTSSLNSVGYFCIFPEIKFKQNMIYKSDNAVINDEIESFFAEYILVLYFLSNWHLSIANFFSLSAKK